MLTFCWEKEGVDVSEKKNRREEINPSAVLVLG